MSQTVNDILIVDDVASSRELLANLIKQVTVLTVRHARNGMEAIQACRDRQPLLVFLDIELPDRNGLDILKDLRVQDPNMFIVMVSGNGTADNVKGSREAGASAFILKPFKPQKVVDALMMYERMAGKPIMRPSLD